MNSFPDDIVYIIIGFLSTKEKVMLREVCKKLRVLVNDKYLYTLSLLNKLEMKIVSSNNVISRLLKIGGKIEALKPGIYIEESEEIHHIHKYFKMNQRLKHEECVVEGCSNRRLGKLYIHLYVYKSNRIGFEGVFREHKTPYCVRCYK